MVRHNGVKAVALALVIALLGMGCTGPIAPPTQRDTDAPGEALPSGSTTADWPEPPAQLDAAFQAPMMAYSWAIFQQTLQEPGNVLISPASIYLALAMTMNGAAGDTLGAMQQALSAQNITQEQLNAACRDWISLLRTTTEQTSVSVANSIWFREGYPVSPDFLQTNAAYFDAGTQALDFAAPQAVDTINAWVNDQTRGAIDGIVDQIDPMAMLYLINAVYFKSQWTTPFLANDTREGDFQTAQGAIQVPFMHRTGQIDYLDSQGVQGVRLPYDDGRYAFVALMPPQGQDIHAFINLLDGQALTRFIHDMRSGVVELALPKFQTRYERSLKETLTGMGMGAAFGAEADFTRMHADGLRELYIADVRHKTFCRVDEQGTEAAAVTSVEMRAMGAFVSDVQITFDRPFVYAIVDQASGTPLFLGLMQDPAEQ